MSAVAAVCQPRGRIGIVATPTYPATIILSGSENHSYQYPIAARSIFDSFWQA